MLDHIQSLDELEKEAIIIDSFLNITCSEDINECSNRGCDLMVYLARSGKMLADAKWHLDNAITESILKNMDTGLSPSILDKLIKSTCIKENYLVNWIERINRSCTHQIDFLRTLISKEKQLMNYK